nr:unnamed protein product [Callosobruchus chinensis]
MQSREGHFDSSVTQP